MYNFSVEWGDGNKDENVNKSITHTYSKAGTYTVKIAGVFPSIVNSDLIDLTNNTLISKGDGRKLISIDQWGDIEWKSMVLAFADCANVTSIAATDTPNLESVTSMAGMFARATLFNGDISSWDVSSVENMSFMFFRAKAFNRALDSWDVSNVTDMNGMFTEADSFNQDLSSWDVSNVTNMSYLFGDCISFNSDLSGWDVAKVTNMLGMFLNAEKFNSDISKWDVSNVTYVYRRSSSRLRYGI